jgi:hypothetical protein
MADRRKVRDESQGGRITRRALLAGGGATAALVACARRADERDAAPTRDTRPPTTAAGERQAESGDTTTTAPEQAAPGADRVLADGEHFPDGFVVPAGQTWALADGAHVTSAGNVVVQGALAMHQPDPARTMRLTFVDVDESAFVGGDTHEVIATDVGLWVIDEGRLDVKGAPKASWTRLTGPVGAGAREITVEDAAGWRPGDEIAITATVPRAAEEYATQSDRAVVAAVRGNRVGLDAGLEHDHPVVDGRWAAEVVNLTRSVVIEGQPDHKAHVVFLHQGMTSAAGFRASDISHLEVAHLGPNQGNDNDEVSSVTGRYALHWHHGAHTTSGVVVDGAVAHDCGAHAFVPHTSDGITFRNCASHATVGDAYWWDPGDLSDGVVYERCIASDVYPDGSAPYKTNGFFAAASTTPLSCVMRGCVAAGVQGPDSAGFFWDNGSVGIWAFEDCLAHNIASNGIRVWQNVSHVNPIDRFTAYGCDVGVNHGAYSNAYQYHGMTLHDCGVGLNVTAVSSADDAAVMEFHDVVVTASDQAVALSDAPVDPTGPTDFRGCRFDRVVVNASHEEHAKAWDFVDCGVTPDDISVEELAGDVVLRVQSDGQAWQLTGGGQWDSIASF